MAGVFIEFAVYVDPQNASPPPPPQLTDTLVDQHIVWRNNALLTASSYGTLWESGNSIYQGHWSLPQGRSSESYARRGPAAATFGQMQFIWRIGSPYITTPADLQNGYNVGGQVWEYMFSGQVTVDTLWEEPL